MRVSTKDVPLNVRRIAAQHLESLRGTELIMGAEKARLADEVVPIYRPDIDGVAYWEFSVVDAAGRRPALRSTGFDSECPPTAREGGRHNVNVEPIGFIVASSGRHDFPVSHWSLNRLPPSLQIVKDDSLRRCSGKQVEAGDVKRLYRLDTLSYVAEDAAGSIVGQSGQIPALIRGLPHDLSRFAGDIASSIARVPQSEGTDETAEKADHQLERSSQEPALTRNDEGGWETLKANYADSFGPLLDQLRVRASKNWEIEELVQKFGEGIIAGTTHRAALLDEACVELVGEGTKYVRASIEENGPPALVLTAETVSLPHEVDFRAIITYASGEREELPFFVVSRNVPSNIAAEMEGGLSTDCEE